MTEQLNKREDTLRDLQRDFRYKLEQVEKVAAIEKEKHDTVEVKLFAFISKLLL